MIASFVANDEKLARFVVFSRWIRDNKTIRSDAFMPTPSLETSVTRHVGISEERIWELGDLTVGKPPRCLHGRADIKAGSVRECGLDVEPRMEVNNPNHANIVDWPGRKDVQKSFAQLIVATADFVPKPLK